MRIQPFFGQGTPQRQPAPKPGQKPLPVKNPQPGQEEPKAVPTKAPPLPVGDYDPTKNEETEPATEPLRACFA